MEDQYFPLLIELSGCLAGGGYVVWNQVFWVVFSAENWACSQSLDILVVLMDGGTKTVPSFVVSSYIAGSLRNRPEEEIKSVARDEIIIESWIVGEKRAAVCIWKGSPNILALEVVGAEVS